MVAEEKRKKIKYFSFLFGTQSKARARWATRLLTLVRATPWADFAVITAQLWTTITAIFSWVNNFAFNFYLWPGSWDCCQMFKTTDLFLHNAGVFPFSLSEMLWGTCISEYLHKDSNLEVSSNRGGFEKNFRKLTHHPYFDGHLGQSGTRYRPQFYKVGLRPSPLLILKKDFRSCKKKDSRSRKVDSQLQSRIRRHVPRPLSILLLCSA